VLGREVVERQQLPGVVGDLRDGLGPLGAVCRRERLDRLLRVRAVLGVVDLLQRLGCDRLCGLRQGVRDISGLVDLTALVAGGREHLGEPLPQTHRAVADDEFGGAHAASAAIAQQVGPRLGGLPQGLRERDQLLGAVHPAPRAAPARRSGPGRASPWGARRRPIRRRSRGRTGRAAGRRRGRPATASSTGSRPPPNRPAAPPRNCSNADTKSPEDSPCR
jgi:hypothetical protein